MIKGLTQAGLVPAASIGATDARADRLDQMTRQYGIRAFANNPALVAESDVIILAVKPQIMAPVLREIAAAVDGTKLIISLAAGVATRTLREHLAKPGAPDPRHAEHAGPRPRGRHGHRARGGPRGGRPRDRPGAVRRGGARRRARRGPPGCRHRAVGLRPGLHRDRDRGARRRRRQDGARPRHRHDARHADRARLGPAPPRDGHASGAAQGHGGLPGRDDHRGHRRPRGRRHPPHHHQRRRARDAALAGAGAPVVYRAHQLHRLASRTSTPT